MTSTDPVIRLDRSKPFSECRGERTPDDPHYRVCYWQGQKVGKNMVLLPFDAQGLLIADDGKTEPWQGLNVESKAVTHYPLYNKDMRELLARKKQKFAAAATPAEDGADAVEDEDEVEANAAEEVNFTSWLRGEVQYQPHVLRAAAKKRYSKNYALIAELVVDLVLDEKLVPEDQVCEAYKRYLPAKVA